jgi:hypothetical protein
MEQKQERTPQILEGLFDTKEAEMYKSGYEAGRRSHLSTIEAQAKTIEALQNGVERVRAALEGSARLATEADKAELGLMLSRYANNLQIVLNASRSALALAQTEKADK